jgi:hypothetical protein
MELQDAALNAFFKNIIKPSIVVERARAANVTESGKSETSPDGSEKEQSNVDYLTSTFHSSPDCTGTGNSPPLPLHN